MRGVSIDVVEPYISESFKPSKYPSKPIIAIHTRDQRDSINLIKQFYVKFPQYLIHRFFEKCYPPTNFVRNPQ